MSALSLSVQSAAQERNCDGGHRPRGAAGAISCGPRRQTGQKWSGPARWWQKAGMLREVPAIRLQMDASRRPSQQIPGAGQLLPASHLHHLHQYRRGSAALNAYDTLNI